MSTELQPTSIDVQAAAIAGYATARGIDVVLTYLDEGRSGVSLRGRAQLQRLLADVQKADRGFDAILVYDVSRWGRFQEVDEAAKLEQVCRDAGAPVIYCAEQFEGAGPIVTALMKTVRRVMAAEYSRDLSEKVSAARRRRAGQGYWTGGQAPFGYERWEITATGAGRMLSPGQHRGPTGHTVLRLGSAEDVRTVRRLFHLYVEHRRSRQQVAAVLNAEGSFGPRGAPWTQTSVMRVLERPTYMGSIADGRFQSRLGGSRSIRASGPWTLVARAVEPIISETTFRRAQTVRAERCPTGRDWTDEALLEGLAACAARSGKVSGAIIDADPKIPCHQVYVRRFGGLASAYALAGMPPPSCLASTLAMKAMRRLRFELSGEFGLLLHARGHTVDICRDTLIVDDWLRLRFCPATPFTRSGRGTSWDVRPLVGAYRYLIAARLAEHNGAIIDYALIDHTPSRSHFRIGPKSKRWRASPQADTLDELAGLIEQRL